MGLLLREAAYHSTQARAALPSRSPSIAEAIISHDTWIHRAVTLGVRPLVRTAVTPNQLTWLRLATGVAAAALIAVDTAPLIWIGCGVFVLSVLLDRADGVLARLKSQFSSFGHKLDLVSDALVNAMILVAVGFAARDTTLADWAVPLGVVAGVSVAAVLFIVMRMEGVKGARAAELGGRAGFDPDDAVLLIPVFIVLGWTAPLVVAAAVSAPLVALYFLVRFRRELWPRARSD